MERILIVSATEKSHTMLAQFLTSCGVQAQLCHASSGAAARRALVDAYISGKKLLSVNAIGGLKSASVEGAPDGDAPAGLEISSIGLQDYFIGLMNEEEGK